MPKSAPVGRIRRDAGARAGRDPSEIYARRVAATRAATLPPNIAQQLYQLMALIPLIESHCIGPTFRTRSGRGCGRGSVP
jgi:hypothetical protein